MKSSVSVRRVVVCVVVLALVALLTPGTVVAGETVKEKEPPAPAAKEKEAPKASAKPCPLVIPLDQIKIEIAAIRYEVEVQGVDGNMMRLPDNRRNNFRYAIVTLRFRKPAGAKVVLAAADLTLHYCHGFEQDVTPCEGLSSFGTHLDEERMMKLPQMQGPGWLKQTTNARCTDASEAYVDCVFAMVEPDARECWICVAQPSASAPYITKGWSP